MSQPNADPQKSSGLLKWLLIIGAGLVLASLAVIVLLPVVVMGMFSDAGSNDEDSYTCTADGDSSEVEIPDDYVGMVEDAAAESGLSPEVIAAQIATESDWSEDAVSPAGAEGIAQFMPETWEEWGNGGDITDPEDSIEAQGRYMEYLMDHMADHADDDEHQTELALAAYNAGHGAVGEFDYDLESMFASSSPDYSETANYVPSIMSAAEGNYSADCTPGGGSVPEGDIVEASMHLAHDERVSLEYSTDDRHGEDEAKDDFVDASTALDQPVDTAYFTDCGVFVATVMRSSGVDPQYQPRGTDAQQSYVEDSDDYQVFQPESEGDLEAGDILIGPGHTYIYTGERHAGDDGRAQGGSLYTRPPSGHHFFLSDSGGSYIAARFEG